MMTSCNKATRLMSDAQERQLSVKERALLTLHTMMCTACRRFGRHLGFIRLAMRKSAAAQRSDDEQS